jgi:hypothetical protein
LAFTTPTLRRPGVIRRRGQVPSAKSQRVDTAHPRRAQQTPPHHEVRVAGLRSPQDAPPLLLRSQLPAHVLREDVLASVPDKQQRLELAREAWPRWADEGHPRSGCSSRR